VGEGLSLLRHGRRAAWVLSIAVLVALAAAAWGQIGYWRDNEVMYRRALAVTRDNWMIHGNLGALYARQGRLTEAMEHYARSIRLKPDHALTYQNIGVALELLGKQEEAIRYYVEAVRLDPKMFEAHRNLGMALQQRGRVPEAVFHYRQALSLRPGDRFVARLLDAAGSKTMGISR
jgi:tetratricopeptide (TPR) repeat protein